MHSPAQGSPERPRAAQSGRLESVINNRAPGRSHNVSATKLKTKKYYAGYLKVGIIGTCDSKQ